MYKITNKNSKFTPSISKKTPSNVQSSLVSLFLFLLFSSTTNAQCAMCRAVLETSGNQAKAKGINDGIVYLMVLPYIIVGLVFFAVYKMYNSNKKV